MCFQLYCLGSLPFACWSLPLQQVHQTKSVPTLRANRWRFAFSLTLTAALDPRYDLSVKDFFKKKQKKNTPLLVARPERVGLGRCEPGRGFNDV